MNLFKFVYKTARTLIPRDLRVRMFTDFVAWRYASVPDDEYLKRMYSLRMGRKLDLDNPQTFTEKLQWLKLYDRRPEYTDMVDKFAVKKIVADKIGSEYVIPLLAVWDNPDDIDFAALPEQFVLKCTHDSGLSLSICRDKSHFDFREAKTRVSRAMTKNNYLHSREWPYKNIKPRIIAEEYMQDGDSQNLPVYKFFTFNGEPKIIQVIQDDKTSYESIDYFDTTWKRLALRQNYPNSKVPLPRPECFDEMLELAAKLSAGIPHVRIDLYQVNGKVYFSEYTFFSDAGFVGFEPPEWDEILGSWLTLPDKH